MKLNTGHARVDTNEVESYISSACFFKLSFVDSVCFSFLVLGFLIPALPFSDLQQCGRAATAVGVAQATGSSPVFQTDVSPGNKSIYSYAPARTLPESQMTNRFAMRTKCGTLRLQKFLPRPLPNLERVFV